MRIRVNPYVRGVLRPPHGCAVLTVEVDNKRSSFVRESTAQQWVADNTVLNKMCND